MSTRFEVVLEHDNTYFFQLRMDDGSVILRSLGSDSKIMTQNEVLHLRNSLRDDSRLVPHDGDDGSFFLVVKDRDGTVLARTPRGRVATPRTYEHLGLERPTTKPGELPFA